MPGGQRSMDTENWIMLLLFEVGSFGGWANWRVIPFGAQRWRDVGMWKIVYRVINGEGEANNYCDLCLDFNHVGGLS